MKKVKMSLFSSLVILGLGFVGMVHADTTSCLEDERNYCNENLKYCKIRANLSRKALKACERKKSDCYFESFHYCSAEKASNKSEAK